MYRRKLLIVLPLIMSTLPMSVWAENEVALEEIVVTAQRRAQSMQDVPVAVSAFDEDTIEKMRIEDIGDIVAATPSFSYTPFSQVDPQLFIRGIGSSDDGAGGDPSVLIFQDDVVFARASGAAVNMFDVQRIEVLRGPQSTLYGKNAVGGAVHVVTNDPTDQFGGSLAVTALGDHDRFESTGVLNVPINDELQFRIAATTKESDGYNRSLTTGRRVDGEGNISVRAKLRYAPSDTFEGILAISYSEDDIYGNTRKPAPAGTFANIGGTNIAPDLRDRQPNEDGFLDREITGFSWKMDWQVGNGTFSSVTAFRNVEINWFQDLAGLPTPPFILRTSNLWREESDQFSQEFRYSFDAMDDRLHGLVGLFYLTEEVDREEEFIRSFAGVASNPEFNQQNDTTSYAVFGQATYDFSDKLHLTLGTRFTADDKEIDLAVVDLSGGTLPSLAPATETYAIDTDEGWDEITSSVSLDYFVTDDVLIYGRIAEGYKSGGFQTAPASAVAALQSYDPETALTFELGVKAEWWDKRIRTNISVFKNDYEDLQVLQLVEAVPGDLSTLILVTDNAADAEIKGVELEVLAALTEGLTVGGTYSYLDAEFEDYVTNKGADLAGFKLRRTPEDSFSIFAEYAFNAGNVGDIVIRADLQQRGDQFFENDNRAVSFEKGYDLINASVRWISTDARWQVSLWGKNLGDEEYRATSISVADSGFSRIGPPRTWGLSFKYNFGDS